MEANPLDGRYLPIAENIFRFYRVNGRDLIHDVNIDQKGVGRGGAGRARATKKGPI